MTMLRFISRVWIVLLIASYMVFKGYKAFSAIKEGGGDQPEELMLAGMIGAFLLTIGVLVELSIEECKHRHLFIFGLILINLGLAAYDGMRKNPIEMVERINQQAAQREFQHYVDAAQERAALLSKRIHSKLHDLDNQRAETVLKIKNVFGELSTLNRTNDPRAAAQLDETIEKLRSTRGAIDQQKIKQNQLKEIATELAPAYWQRAKSAEDIREQCKDILSKLNVLEIAVFGAPNAKMKPPTFDHFPTSIGMANRAMWAVQNPLEACVGVLWRVIGFNLLLSLLVLVAGHLKKKICAKLIAPNVTSIDSVRKRAA